MPAIPIFACGVGRENFLNQFFIENFVETLLKIGSIPNVPQRILPYQRIFYPGTQFFDFPVFQ